MIFFAMKNNLSLLLYALLALFLCACDRTPALQKIEGPAQGTTYHLTWWTSSHVDAVKLKADIDATFANIDKQISSYRDDSDIELFNRNPSLDWQEFPAEVVDLLQIAATVYRSSTGCYDPTVKPLLSLWGFFKEPFTIPSPDQIASARANVGFDKIEFDIPGNRIRKLVPELSIDLSSMGEGYSVYRLAKVFEGAGITNYILEIGGDMYVKGARAGQDKWRVAIARPAPEEMSIQKVIDINDEKGISLNTSGTYRHYYDAEGKRYSHIFDARTGAPVTHDLVSATVIGTDPRLTDAWATAMLCLGKTSGEAVATKENINVFFIQQEGGQLIESISPHLQKNRAVTIK